MVKRIILIGSILFMAIALLLLLHTSTGPDKKIGTIAADRSFQAESPCIFLIIYLLYFV